ncbi:MAG: hypothetical protein AAGA95_00540 [Pseudomonadota bacterium]
MKKTISIALVCTAMATGCVSNNGIAVLTTTGTTIGLSLGQDASGSGVETVLGYKRAEFAYVPTNRDGGEKAGNSGDGARDSANVLTELYYGGTKESVIYQRLAVGDIAVARMGAAALFLRDNTGTVDADTAKALQSIDNNWGDSDED